jgi:MFS family permease
MNVARVAGVALGATLVPGSRIGRRLALAALIDAFGTGMFLTGSAIYFTQIVGLSAAQVGLGLSVAGLAGLLGSVPLAAIGDRLGSGRVYVALQLWRALAYTAYPLVGGFGGFIVVAAMIEIGDAALPGIAQAVVGQAEGEAGRVTTLAKVRAVRNLGFGLGAAAATAVLVVGSPPAFLAMVLGNAAAILVSALLLHRAGIARIRTARVASVQLKPVRDRFYLAAALLNGILSVHMTLLFIGLPLWLTHYTRVPVLLVGVLVVLNTVMAVALQARFAQHAERLSGAVDCMVWAGFALAGFAAAAYLTGRAHTVAVAVLLAVLAVVLLTIGELWQSAGGWAVSYELAPPTRLAQYLATFQLGTGVQVMAAPAIIVGLVLPHALGWLGLALVTAAAGLLVRPAVQRARSSGLPP